VWKLGSHNAFVFPHFLIMSRQVEPTGRRKHLLTDRMKALAASALAQKIGYLKAENFPGSRVFVSLPVQSFTQGRIINCKDTICLVVRGMVEICHATHNYFIKQLPAGTLFGEMPLLGQSMLITKALAGEGGAEIGFMDEDTAKRWARINTLVLLEKIGGRLFEVEEEHYSSHFQLADSRVAALLLRLAGKGSIIEGYSHEDLGEKLGLYRETVTIILDGWKLDKLIEVGRMKITILEKRALKELSEL
jgi:CRP-like cAMP-binding protein